MASRVEDSALSESIALMGKAFASPVRLELLDLLAPGAANRGRAREGQRPVDGERLAASPGAARRRSRFEHAADTCTRCAPAGDEPATVFSH